MKTVASKKTKTLWEKWYETIKKKEQLQSNNDVTVQCIDFCEVSGLEARSCRTRRVKKYRGFLRTSEDNGVYLS